jgi:CubicO group peptidase (beta-lactamase class C family)
MRLAILLHLSASLAMAAPCPTRASWPTDTWPDETVTTIANKADEIAALERYAFTLTGEDGDREGIRTNALLIARGGVLVYERYARGFTASMRHIAWSVTKSVTNALAGVAIHQGVVSLDTSICATFPKVASDEHCRITVQALLELASGLDWQELYENESYQVSSVLAMLYGVGSSNRARFVLDHSLASTPGSGFFYSSGDSTLLAGVLNRSMRDTYGETWMWDLLFDPIGAESAVLERDPKGTPVGGSWFYARPRDMLRFGFLFLNDGCWDGQRILPEEWVADSTRVTAAFRNHRDPENVGAVQGRSWWINVPVPEANVREKPWPSLPEDTFLASGHWGQYIAVFPSDDVVVVRVGDDRDEEALDLNALMALALQVAR